MLNLNSLRSRGRKEGNVLFNDALNTFYLRLYGVRHMVKDYSDSEGWGVLISRLFITKYYLKKYLQETSDSVEMKPNNSHSCSDLYTVVSSWCNVLCR